MVKRILHITPQAPDNDSGGAIGVAQTLVSLAECGNNIDYIGPEIKNNVFKKLYTSVYELEPEANIIMRILRLLRGVTNSRYNSWKKLNIDYAIYDLIVMDFTKLDYVLKRIDHVKLFVRVHNIEQDYARRDYLNNRSFSKYIIFKLAKRQEKRIINAAHKIITLSNEDRDRINELYGNHQNIDIVPVCISGKNNVSTINACNEIRLLMTGSLWFGENKNGIMWFIENVCPLLDCKYSLTIAGSHPTDDLIRLSENNKNINLVDTPIDMSPYFMNADLVICPIFNGAGMKVKVAEALSYGLPVVGTKHAFIGYDIVNGINSYIADNASDFAFAINSYAQMTEDEKLKLKEDVKLFYNKNYDIEQSIKKWKKIVGVN